MNDYGGTIVSSSGREKKIMKRKKSDNDSPAESSSSEDDFDNFEIIEFKKTGTEKRVKKVKKPKVKATPGKYVLKNPNAVSEFDDEKEDRMEDAEEQNEENQSMRELEVSL